jgi:NitT/TauT family transport system substrate-binding protein
MEELPERSVRCNGWEVSMSTRIVLGVLALATACLPTGALAADKLKIAIGQIDAWANQAPTLGVKAGIFRKHGIELEAYATQGAGETIQAVISGSADIGIGIGTAGAMRAFTRGAPIRVIAAAYVGVGDQYWYVPANSPLKSLAEATEKHTMAYSTNGATSHVIALGFVKQLGVKAKPTATGGPPATLTMTMSGQIDIGWAVVPFGLAELEQGKIRVVARGPDVPTLRNQTIRVQIVNANALKARKDVMVRFMRAYRESLDWMYSDPLAVKYYAETIKQPESLVVLQRDRYNPKEALSPDRLSDIEQVMADGVEMKFLDAPLTKEQLAELFQIPPPGS